MPSRSAAELNVAICAALGIDVRGVTEVRIRLATGKNPRALVVREVTDLQLQELRFVRERFELKPID